MVIAKEFSLNTQGDTDIIDITAKVAAELNKAKLKNGIVNISVVGSTAAITTCEYEDGLVSDLKEIFEKIIPKSKSYHHDTTWGDANGYAHLRSTLLGTTKTFSFCDGKLILGTWQQIILLDFDNRPRTRRVHLQFIGE